MAKAIGCIGCGNMGKALMEGLAKALTDSETTFFCFDHSDKKTAALQASGISALNNGKAVAEKADIIILAVKPGNLGEVLAEIAEAMTSDKMVVSLAAGYGLARLRNHLGQKPGICRIMPTTTAKVGKGVFAVCFDPLTSNPQQKKDILDIFSELGLCTELTESHFSAYAALIGAAPAYIFEMLAAMQQAGTTLGFSADQSRKMLLEICCGCAELAAQNTSSFMDLRDMVCSPAGLTIAGINSMDRNGFIGIVVDAVELAHKRAREMENE